MADEPTSLERALHLLRVAADSISAAVVELQQLDRCRHALATVGVVSVVRSDFDPWGKPRRVVVEIAVNVNKPIDLGALHAACREQRELELVEVRKAGETR